jgi:hypothetical protein
MTASEKISEAFRRWVEDTDPAPVGLDLAGWVNIACQADVTEAELNAVGRDHWGDYWPEAGVALGRRASCRVMSVAGSTRGKSTSAATARSNGRRAGAIRITRPCAASGPSVRSARPSSGSVRWTPMPRGGAHIDPRKGDRPFSKVADEWRNTWADLAPKTQVGYASILNRHVLPRFGALKVGAIGVEDVQRFANELADGRAPNTVRRVVDVVRNVMRVAVERRYIATNPCAAVRPPRKDTGRKIDINPADPRRASRARRCAARVLAPSGPARCVHGPPRGRALGAASQRCEPGV